MSLISAARTLFTLGKGITVGLKPAAENRNPFDLFDEWFSDAKRAGLVLPESMTLATASKDGTPSARMVLLKGSSPAGFRFFTNYESRKGIELQENPKAALVFHWGILQRQVRVEGSVQRLSFDESNTYFQSRPRGSRIGAWASKQSRQLETRKILDTRVAEMEKRFEGKEVPLPEFWGGFLLVPDTIEFWQGRSSRLHDRLVFRRENENWITQRLYP